MRSLFKDVANQLIQQLTPEDLKEIMDSTIETVLARMTPEQRLDFSKDIVNSAVGKILAGFDEQQRAELLTELLPTILRSARPDGLSDEQLAALIRRSFRDE